MQSEARELLHESRNQPHHQQHSADQRHADHREQSKVSRPAWREIRMIIERHVGHEIIRRPAKARGNPRPPPPCRKKCSRWSIATASPSPSSRSSAKKRSTAASKKSASSHNPAKRACIAITSNVSTMTWLKAFEAKTGPS